VSARRFAYDLPFGAQLLDGGRVRVRLWAPACATVALELAGDEVAMTGAGDGWFEAEVAAAPGARYGFRVPGFDRLLPDPGARAQAEDVHGPSLVVDPRAYHWRHGDWRGRPWHETVLYELHVGAFSPEGDFDGVRRRLDSLAALGVTAIELMPVADFSGRRNWGYDGVLPFAPDRAYGTPDALKALIDAAHGRGLMVFLDVVYNHFGPDGNYLHLTAPGFFTERVRTPWGAAIDFARAQARAFFVHNACYWIEEFRIDGLRLDAVHAIHDQSSPDILEEIADAVHAAVGAGRHVHLVLENDANQARYLARDQAGTARHYVAQWNDDLHHAAHAAVTGESGGYYLDYADRPAARLATALAEGFVYQGQPSAYRHGESRGSASAHLPPAAFVSFLQNHDQVGNRAFGERLTRLAGPEAVRAVVAIVLLAPQVPLLVMGEEWAATAPFLYFADFHDDLAKAVREGRRAEFARFSEFADPQRRNAIPDPNAPETFAASRLDWSERDTPPHDDWLAYYRRLLDLRARRIVPLLAGAKGGAGHADPVGAHGLAVRWRLAKASTLALVANLGAAPQAGFARPDGELLLAVPEGAADGLTDGTLPAWSCAWFESPAS
jgi:maltooligosyltrehalose trehalohydrolase